MPTDSRYVQSSFVRTRSPVWPADKYITLEEGFHFAACARRIGKLASLEKRKLTVMPPSDDEIGLDPSLEIRSPIFLVWKALGCCDGLCGSALGMAVRGGFDCTVAWLCSTVSFGGQTIVEAMEHRLNLSLDDTGYSPSRLGEVNPKDFDCRPPGYESQESETVVHPKPIPEVVESIKKILTENSEDEILKSGKQIGKCLAFHFNLRSKVLTYANSVSHEITFVLGTLEYVVARLSSPPTIESSWKNRHLQKDGAMMVGSFLNLHCGHNNPYSSPERKRLKSLLLQATTPASPQMSA